MRAGARPRWSLLLLALGIGSLPGCAAMRANCELRDLRPCTDGFARTADGWELGIRRYRPEHPDPGKLPVVLCHGLGLNGTFWTLTSNHLAQQLADDGYEVFVPDMRGSGASHRTGRCGRINAALRQTFLPELRSREWTMDDEAFYDVPAILDFVQRETGCDRVNWVGHSLGGMLMFPYLELYPEPQRIHTFVAMGSPAVMLSAPEQFILRANRNLCRLMRMLSTSRIARPLMLVRPKGLERIDRFYYFAENVDDRTIDRFYGYTLEDPGPGALRQLDHYLEFGRLVSADRSLDYAALLERIRVPTLVVAGEGDVLAPMESCLWTYEHLGGFDKTLQRFGRRDGHKADYGHCDLVWSRHAPVEIFPAVRAWLNSRQPGSMPSLQRQSLPVPAPQGPRPSQQRQSLPMPAHRGPGSSSGGPGPVHLGA